MTPSTQASAERQAYWQKAIGRFREGKPSLLDRLLRWFISRQLERHSRDMFNLNIDNYYMRVATKAERQRWKELVKMVWA